MRIEGPCCTWTCFADVKFEVKTMEGRKVGAISNEFEFDKEAFSDADKFGISFRDFDLGVEKKAILLGAVFLIDFMFIENNPKW